jgi:predicted  nucleic acid-binding Zn-ribbon protein
VLTQLNTTKADNSKIETQVLELLKDIETDEAEVVNMREQIGQLKQTLEQTRRETELMAGKLEGEIEQIQAEWDSQAQTVPTEPLDIFKRVAETYDGEAMAVIEKQGARTDSYSCGGCFMGITAESVNLLMTGDDIIRCPNCTRILIVGG